MPQTDLFFKEWPLNGGADLGEEKSVHNLLLTGHEDGSVRFWDASGVALSHLYTINTSGLFVGEECEAPAEEEEWPPFRKVFSFETLKLIQQLLYFLKFCCYLM